MRIFFTLIIAVSISLNGFAQNNSAKQNYLDAYSELESMLAGQQPFSFKRAVFITENAFLEGQLNYTEFQKQIDDQAKQIDGLQSHISEHEKTISKMKGKIEDYKKKTGEEVLVILFLTH